MHELKLREAPVVAQLPSDSNLPIIKSGSKQCILTQKPGNAKPGAMRAKLGSFKIKYASLSSMLNTSV